MNRFTCTILYLHSSAHGTTWHYLPRIASPSRKGPRSPYPRENSLFPRCTFGIDFSGKVQRFIKIDGGAGTVEEGEEEGEEKGEERGRGGECEEETGGKKKGEGRGGGGKRRRME